MRTRGGLLASALFALGCAHDGALSPIPPEDLVPPLHAGPVERLVLIGDAGEPAETSLLDAAKKWITDNPAETTVVFLGDNHYPWSANRAGSVLGKQREVAPAIDSVRFVPGNHDWHWSGSGLFNLTFPGRVEKLRGRSGASWIPESLGSIGPQTLDRGAYRIVAIDSEKWRTSARLCELGIQRHCEAKEAAELELETELNAEGAAPAVVVAHHPLTSVGEHAGTCKKSRNIFEVGGQDLDHDPYRAYVKSVGGVVKQHRPLLFAAGHDHSMQWVRHAEFGVHVVSGAGAKDSCVESVPTSALALRRLGFAAIDFAPGASPQLRVFVLDDEGVLVEVLREPLRP